jgi:ATP-binding cassette, subfamily C, bacterial
MNKNGIWSFFKDNKILGMLAFLSLVSYPLQEIILPDYYGKLIDNLGKQNQVLHYAKTILFFWLLSYLLFLLYDYTFLKINSKLESWIRHTTFQDILSSQEINNQPLNKIEFISQMTKYPIFHVETFSNIQEVILPSCLFIIVLAIYLFRIDSTIFIIFLLGILLIWVVTFFVFPILLKKSCSRDLQHNKIIGLMDDLLSNSFSIFTNAQTGNEIDLLKKEEQHFRKVYEEGSVNLMLYRNTILLIVLSLIFFIIYISYQKFTKGLVSKGKIVTLIVIFTYWLSDIKKLYEHVAYWIYTQGNLKITSQNLQRFLGGRKICSTQEEPPIDFTITIKDLTIKHGTKIIMNKVNIKIPQNSTLVIKGKVGSGKSTLIYALLGLQQVEKGTFNIGNMKLSDKNMDYWRSLIHYVPQETILFDRTLYENLVYGNSNVTKEECYRRLNEYNLSMLVKTKEDLERKVGKNGSSLSGGQRRLVVLFRSLITPKPIILMDEPTSNLDENTSGMVYQLLNILDRKKTLLIISHDEHIYNSYKSIDMNNLSH